MSYSIGYNEATCRNMHQPPECSD